ncbi:flagellar motor protein MotB [Gracilimonas sp. Q87]|uniref:OmpA/MotB family protein n=1 Tax=Gracilimonas sp. Q87 TaxID=3384766 RepID=UPI0039842DB5
MGKSKGSSGNWLMTYGDLMTLLLVFFVLLYTLTPSINDGVFKDFISYFQKSSGFFDAQNLKSQDFEIPADSLNVEDLLEKRVEYWQAFADLLEEFEFSSEVDIEVSSSGVKITLSDSLTFESGSSELLPNAKTVLLEVADRIDAKVIEIEVQGHTDDVPIRENSIHETNWHLGAARSVSVVQYLQEKSEIKPGNFKASSLGEYNPIADNNTESGRRKNRRVEIYLRDELLMNSRNTELWF